ncbi:MAG: heavy metal-binding domain-containing protein [Myxococcota bacterium]
MTFRITPLDTLAPHSIVEDLGLVFAYGGKIERLVEELTEEAERLGANAVVRVRFSFEGRGVAYGAAVRVE